MAHLTAPKASNHSRHQTAEPLDPHLAHPKAACTMVTLRNLAISLYNRLRIGEMAKAPSLPSWLRSMKLSAALRHIRR
jgi:hypothetical protein